MATLGPRRPQVHTPTLTHDNTLENKHETDNQDTHCACTHTMMFSTCTQTLKTEGTFKYPCTHTYTISHTFTCLSPIFTGKPGGRRRVMKSLSLAKRALEMAIRSMMGATWSARDRGWDSQSHSFALNLEEHCEITQTHTNKLTHTNN